MSGGATDGCSTDGRSTMRRQNGERPPNRIRTTAVWIVTAVWMVTTDWILTALRVFETFFLV